jgi:hypothetical protein
MLAEAEHCLVALPYDAAVGIEPIGMLRMTHVVQVIDGQRQVGIALELSIEDFGRGESVGFRRVGLQQLLLAVVSVGRAQIARLPGQVDAPGVDDTQSMTRTGSDGKLMPAR